MPRSRKRRNRRARKRNSVAPFAVLDSIDNENFSRIVEEAHNANFRFKGRLIADSQIELHSNRACGEADDLTNLFFPSLRSHTTAPDFVKQLHNTLYQLHIVPVNFSVFDVVSSPKRLESPIVRCQIKSRRTARSAPFFARVTVRSFQLAEAIVRYSPLLVGASKLYVELDKYQDIPTAGGKFRDSVGRPIYRVDPICLGQLRADTFETMWTSDSHPDPDLDMLQSCHAGKPTLSSHLGVDSAGRKLFLNTNNSVQIREADPDFSGHPSHPSCFKTTYSRLRIEIPFASVFAVPRLETTNSPTDNLRAISIPLRHPPLIYRATNLHLRESQADDSSWDCATATVNRTQWARTVDPSEDKSFSQASAIRFNVYASEVTALIVELGKVGFSTDLMRRTRTVAISRRARVPDADNSFRHAATVFNVPFSVRYMVACILSFPRVDLASLDPSFWKVLYYGMSEQTSLNILSFLHSYLSGVDCLNPFYQNDEDDDFNSQSDNAYGSVESLLPLVTHFKEICGSSPIIISDSSDDEAPDEPIYIHGSDSEESDSSYDSDSVDSDGLQDFNVDETLGTLRIDESPWSSSHLNRNKPDRSAEIHNKFTSLSKSKKQLAPIRRVLVTPTRIVALPPEVDLLNRVLRHFSDFRDRFIRVVFCDEDGSSIAHVGLNKDLLARVRDTVRNGLIVAGERFVFLAFSNSQLREHGTWMYNETQDTHAYANKPPTADDIRAWMGEFSDIRVAGK